MFGTIPRFPLSLSLVTFFAFGLSVTGPNAFAESRHEKNLRLRLSRLVEASQQIPEEETKPAQDRVKRDASPPDVPKSGLQLELKVDDGEAPHGLTYSFTPSPAAAVKPKDTDAGLRPGVYNLNVQVAGKEVFRRQVIAMDNFLTKVELHYSHQAFSLRQTVDFPQIKFMPGQKKVAKTSLATVKDLAGFLKTHESVEVFGFEVHTDANGDAEKNQELTDDRAVAVRNLLVKKGIDPQRIKATGMGATKPVAPNDTKENRLLNRRVEYVILQTSSKPLLLGDR
ncbi:MAG: OmpA family protein [Chitinophagaceae bacterium]|nr:OmpA family protein [Oligoflexus sp.]